MAVPSHIHSISAFSYQLSLTLFGKFVLETVLDSVLLLLLLLQCWWFFVCWLFKFLSLGSTLAPLGEGSSVEKKTSIHWPVGKTGAGEHFLEKWLMWEAPVHSRRCPHWAGDPRLYKRVGCVSLVSFKVSASVHVSKFLFWVPVQASFSYGS